MLFHFNSVRFYTLTGYTSGNYIDLTESTDLSQLIFKTLI